MNVYILDADVNKYRQIFYQGSEDIVDFNRRFDGTPMMKRWTGKTKFTFARTRLPKGDTPGLSTHIPVLSPGAVMALGELLENNGELLPISCDGEEYFLYNVTRLIDALDETNCELERFADGTILDIDRYSFFKEALIGVVLFKVPQNALGDVYVTDSFVARVKAAKLKGFEFRLVWSSEE